MSLEGKSEDEIKALASLADDVLSKPETAGVFQRLVKKNNPSVSMPLVELEDKVVKALGARDQQISKLEGTVAVNQAEKNASVMFENLRDEGIVTTRATFNALVKYASENGFMTTEMGLKRASMQQQIEQEAAEPTPSTSTMAGAFSLGEGDVGKAFMKDPAGTARTQAALAMEELAKARTTGKRAH